MNICQLKHKYKVFDFIYQANNNNAIDGPLSSPELYFLGIYFHSHISVTIYT